VITASPEEMIERKPELRQWEDGMPGGLENPLGARALYLTTNGVDYGYRIHGTPEWFSIGKNASSGCIRMINQDVMDLYGRVADGAKVIVLNADGSMPTGLTLPPPQPKKPKPVAEPAVVADPVIVPPITILPPPNLGAPVIVPQITPAVDAAAATTPAIPAVEPAAPAACLVKAADGTCICTVALVNGLCPVL
jgi:L,D-transpeptidase catalytic domain